MDRGIIVSPVSSLDSEGQVNPLGGLDPGFLRFCALYWDKIDYPDPNIGGTSRSNDADLQVLTEHGVLTRTTGHLVKRQGDQWKLTFIGEHPVEFWACAQLHSLVKHGGPEAGWSIGQAGTQLTSITPDISAFLYVDRHGPHAGLGLRIPSEVLRAQGSDFQRGPSLDVSLRGSLPVPVADTSIEDVLEFKGKYRNELDRFQYAMDGFCLEVVGSPDPRRQLRHAVEEIDQALVELHQVMRPSLKTRITSSISTKISLTDIAKGAAIGAVADISLGLPGVCALAGGVLQAVEVSLESNVLRPPSVPDRLRPFAFLYHADTELG